MCLLVIIKTLEVFMFDYTGIECPVCQKAFQKQDDVVVCPKCGAPYHRACYQLENHCMFEELHAQGKGWQPPKPVVTETASAEVKDKECPICGTLNAQSAFFCNGCGNALPGTGRGPQQPQQPTNPYTAFGGTAPVFAFDPMGGVNPSEQVEDQVSFGDISKLIKQNTMYYLPVFKQMHQVNRKKFNFSAFLFSGGWMLYRKQYKLGGIITAIMFALYIGSLLAYAYLTAPVYYELLGQIGVDTAGLVVPTSEQISQLYFLLQQDMQLYIRFISPMFFYGGMLVVMIFTGVKGNRFYFNHCVRTIKKIKTSGNQSDANAAMESRGGVNVPIALCMLACYFILSNITAFI